MASPDSQKHTFFGSYLGQLLRSYRGQLMGSSQPDLFGSHLGHWFASYCGQHLATLGGIFLGAINHLAAYQVNDLLVNWDMYSEVRGTEHQRHDKANDIAQDKTHERLHDCQQHIHIYISLSLFSERNLLGKK